MMHGAHLQRTGVGVCRAAQGCVGEREAEGGMNVQ